MSLPAQFPVIIEGNVTSAKNNSFSDTIVDWEWNALLITNADCMIYNNFFSGIRGEPGNPIMMTIDGYHGGCKIVGNTFQRADQEIAAYIHNHNGNTFSHIITDNIFDGYECASGDEDLVKGLYGSTGSTPINTGTIYERNKNQSNYAVVSITPGLMTTDSTGLSFSSDIGSGPGILAATDTTSGVRIFTLTFSIGDSIPTNTAAINMSVGVWAQETVSGFAGLTTGILHGNNFTLTGGKFNLSESINNNHLVGTFTPAAQTILDVRYVIFDDAVPPFGHLEASNSYNFNIVGNYNTMVAATQYITVGLQKSDGTSSENNDLSFFNDGQALMYGKIDVLYELKTAKHFLWALSPVVIKYRW